ncbi:arsenic resistance N-acetyltransferase ArsN2 [Spirosoma sp. KNUC1025]|uniref:arsenic resistance N-acetyltransferase ArsN2 n=1 Tax=Spirosoma sp. KNUC1025 TaxID=2894082 RepID=UPI003870BBF6|nr:arsenic resistance N-acetyltransferase ArsN2 [Spirosoma sp. KNUC1025]
MSIAIKPADAEQVPELAQLLNRNHLSADDLPQDLSHFWLAVADGQIIGSIGIEIYGQVGLLRSVCVDENYRSRGIAQKLFNTAHEAARQQSVSNLYLLTTTADRYFERFGFQRVNRSEAPESIQQTTQFSLLCPSSAVVMKQTF